MAKINKKIIEIAATIIGVLSIVWGLLFSLYSLVDPVGPVYVYFAIPFVLFSLAFSNKGRLISWLFATFFVLSHAIAYWTVRDAGEQTSVVEHSRQFDEDIFIRCSDTMFKDMKENQKQLTSQQQSNFDSCLSKQQW